MTRVKVTYVVDEDVARATRVHAARMDRRDSEVVEAALRSYLGLGLLDELWAAAAGLPPSKQTRWRPTAHVPTPQGTPSMATAPF